MLDHAISFCSPLFTTFVFDSTCEVKHHLDEELLVVAAEAKEAASARSQTESNEEAESAQEEAEGESAAEESTEAEVTNK